MCAQKVLTSQVVGMVNMNEVYMDVDAIMNNVQEEPETRDVVNNTNPEGKHNDEKTMEEQVHEKTEERDGASSSSFTYHARQSSTKTEAVLRYVDFPISNQVVQFVTPLSNTGPVKPEKRDVTINTNLEGRYDDEEMVEKQVDEQPEQRDVMVDITLEGEHDEKKTVGDGIDSDSDSDLDPEYNDDEVVEKKQYEKPEDKDVEDDIDYIFDFDSEYDKDEVVEKQPYDAPRLDKEEIEAGVWKMKAGVCFVQGDGLDEAEDAIEINEEDMVREDFALINWEDSKTEEALPEVTEKVLKAEADC
jgi:hypothetical protein